MSESYAEFQEADGSVRMAGQLAYPQATPSDVLTVQSDGSIAAASGGGGSSPVSVVLTAAGQDVSAGATYDFKPDTIEDDLYDEDTLMALPTGLGLTVATDGSDGTFTTTADGVWAFSAWQKVTPGNDPTWEAILCVNNFDNTLPVAFAGDPGILTAQWSATLNLPSGATFKFQVRVGNAATGAVTQQTQYLQVVRLA